MQQYSVAGLTLASDVVLPELPKARETTVDWTFEIVAGPLAGRGDTPAQASLTAEDETWKELRLDDDRLFLSFPGMAEFAVLAAERRLLGAPVSGVADGSLRHLLLDQVIPHILAWQGWVVIHASAVATPAGAIAFIGPSGAGKSSLAASFAAHGSALLSDDFLQLRRAGTGFTATPSYPGLRLWPDSRDFFAELGTPIGPVVEGVEKQRLLTCSPVPPESVPLVAIIALANLCPGDEAEFTLAPMAPREGFLAVFEHGFRLGHLERERQLAEFKLYASLAGSTELLRLEYRRDFARLAPIRSVILETVAVQLEEPEPLEHDLGAP